MYVYTSLDFVQKDILAAYLDDDVGEQWLPISMFAAQLAGWSKESLVYNDLKGSSCERISV
jgi:hypothetical protein